MANTWQCPKCDRKFTRKNQRHACGTGDREHVLRNRPTSVVETYNAIESFIKKLGSIEIVARDRYVLFRSTRIFTDLSIMTDAVRVAIHLEEKVDDTIFIKTVDGGKTVTHVIKIKETADVKNIEPYLKAAYQFSIT